MSFIARLTFALGLALFLPLVGHAAEDVDPARIAQMRPKELESFVDTITASVAQDSLKLRDAGIKGDCMELARISNSMALGYGYLQTANDSIDLKVDQQLLPLKARIIQARVLAFAARVRAEEWNRQRCASYAAPADQVDNPRYQRPAKLRTEEFTDAIIEARQAAEINLSGAVAAARSGQCASAISAARGLHLLIPYLDKLLTDISGRPLALGPVASRRGLEGARAQLIAAFNRLDAEYSKKCGVQPVQPQTDEQPAAPQG